MLQVPLQQLLPSPLPESAIYHTVGAFQLTRHMSEDIPSVDDQVAADNDFETAMVLWEMLD